MVLFEVDIEIFATIGNYISWAEFAAQQDNRIVGLINMQDILT